MKRYLTLLIIPIVLLLGYLYFSHQKTTVVRNNNMLRAIPITAPLYFELSSFDEILSTEALEHHLGIFPAVAELKAQFARFDSISRHTPNLSSKPLRQRLIVAIDLVGKDQLRPVFISPLKTTEERQNLQATLAKFLGVSPQAFEKRNYNGYRIYSSQPGKFGYKLHYCATNGIVILSTERLLVEKALLQLNASNITSDNYHRHLNQVPLSDDVQVFINHQKLPDLFYGIINKQLSHSSNEFGEREAYSPYRDLQKTRGFAGWSDYELTFDHETLQFKGHTAANDSANHFLAIFEGQTAVKTSAPEYLPAQTNFYVNLAFSKPETFFEKLTSHFKQSNDFYRREERIRKINKFFKLKLLDELQQAASDEITAAITSITTPKTSNGSVFIINTENQKKSQNLLNRIAQQINQEINDAADTLLIDEKPVTVYQFPFPSLPQIWLGDLFRFAQTRYVTTLDKRLIFASSKQEISTYLHQLSKEKTLANTETFEKLKDAVNARENLSVYLNITGCMPLLEDLVSPKLRRDFKSDLSKMEALKSAYFQVSSSKELFDTQLSFLLYSAPPSSGLAKWEYNIGHALHTAPQLVINHYDRANREIVFQDQANQLHLLDTHGQKRWVIPIDGKIMGKIHQIDYLKNGKLQYLFNTKEKLYLLDRNGNKVGKFPVSLPASATNGVSVFDYDHNKNYRYFIACNNHKVYAFDRDGQLLKGWKFNQTGGIVSSPVQHFAVGTKDYIVFHDEQHLYILQRNGQTRVKCTTIFNFSSNPVFLRRGNQPAFITTSDKGSLYFVAFDGSVKEKKFGRYSSDHFFLMADMNNNKIPDFIFMDGDELKVMDENGKKLMETDFENDITIAPQIITTPSGAHYIAICDAEEEEIFVIDSKGKNLPGFPLPGSSPFVLGKLHPNKYDLIVTDSNNRLLAYPISLPEK